jgi:hypothetical protein
LIGVNPLIDVSNSMTRWLYNACLCDILNTLTMYKQTQ